MREQECNTGLGLGIGGGEHCIQIRKLGDRDRKPPVQFHILFPTHMTEEEKEEQRPTKEHRRVPRPRNHNEEEDTTIGGMGDGASRKKLRLTKEQSSLLENSFRNHNTLNTNQKQELAEKLNLTPRQVEVWFQNRRARSKLKQTEVDCEFLKKCCETLSNENRRLKMELQELQAVNASPAATPFFVPLQKVSTLTMCPSCKTIDAGDGSKDSSMAC